MIIVIIAVVQPIVILTCLLLFAVKFRLEESGLRRIVSIAVRDACSEADHPVIKTEDGFTGYKVGSKVLIITFRQFHCKHSVHAAQRAASGKVFRRSCHRRTFQGTVQEFKRKMNGGRTGQTVPVPSFLYKTTSGTGDGISFSHNLYRAVALITSVTIIFRIDFSTPYICSISFQCHHPVCTAENSCRSIVINKKTVGSLCRLNTFFPEEMCIPCIPITYQTQIIGGQSMIECISLTGQIS